MKGKREIVDRLIWRTKSTSRLALLLGEGRVFDLDRSLKGEVFLGGENKALQNFLRETPMRQIGSVHLCFTKSLHR